MHKFAKLLAISVGLASLYAGAAAAAAAPAIATAQIKAAAPVTANQAVGNVAAANSPTNFAITSCSGCANYFAIDNSGKITLTSAGSAAINSSRLPSLSYSPVVQASNATGSASSQVVLNFYADGSTGAPVGATVIFPTILGVYAVRPAWQVAGIDYAVGPVATTSYTPWTSFSHAGCSVGATSVSCNGSSCANIVINGVDFSVNNGAQLILGSGCTNFTVSNSKWNGSNLTNVSTGVIDVAATGTLVSNDINGGSVAGTVENQSTLIFVRTTATSITLHYNYFHNAAQHVIEFIGGATVNYSFNLIKHFGVEAGGHANCLQFGGGVSTPTFTYNTMVQSVIHGAECVQVYDNSGGTMNAPTVSNNLFISRAYGTCAGGVTTGCTMSFIVHGSGKGTGATAVTGTALAQNNYFDTSGTLATGSGNLMAGAFYPGSFPSPWVLSGNISLLNGASFSNTP